MTLPNATLFPQVMLPLHIFEDRYKLMLRDALESHRTFAVALQKPGSNRETPSSVAGLGLIRACVTHSDGSSHLILQGIGRVELTRRARLRPYRLYQYQMLRPEPTDSLAVDALTTKVLDLVAERFKSGHQMPTHLLNKLLKFDEQGTKVPASAASLENVISFLEKLENPGQLADLVSCTLLVAPSQRQSILETVDLEARLKRLIHFLMAEQPQNMDDADEPID